MTVGAFRNGHPRVVLALPGRNGLFEVEFIVDTGFEGDLALPADQARQLDAVPGGPSIRALADGSLVRCAVYEVSTDEIPMDWEPDPRLVEILVLEGNPLLGMQLLNDRHLHVEVTEGGEVAIEPF